MWESHSNQETHKTSSFIFRSCQTQDNKCDEEEEEEDSNDDDDDDDNDDYDDDDDDDDDDDQNSDDGCDSEPFWTNDSTRFGWWHQFFFLISTQ